MEKAGTVMMAKEQRKNIFILTVHCQTVLYVLTTTTQEHLSMF